MIAAMPGTADSSAPSTIGPPIWDPRWPFDCPTQRLIRCIYVPLALGERQGRRFDQPLAVELRAADVTVDAIIAEVLCWLDLTARGPRTRPGGTAMPTDVNQYEFTGKG